MPHSKILFRLKKFEDDYPPAEVESVWAVKRDDGTFEIDNIPFFATQATLGDIVEASYEGEDAYYLNTRQRSGNSLIRVVLFNKLDPIPLHDELRRVGCSTEQSHLRSLIAVSVPPTTNIETVREILERGLEQGLWDYEEPLLRQ